MNKIPAYVIIVLLSLLSCMNNQDANINKGDRGVKKEISLTVQERDYPIKSSLLSKTDNIFFSPYKIVLGLFCFITQAVSANSSAEYYNKDNKNFLESPINCEDYMEDVNIDNIPVFLKQKNEVEIYSNDELIEGFEIFTELGATISPDSTNIFSLSKRINHFLTNPSENYMVILGESGSGKTLNSRIETQRLLETYNNPDDYFPLYISLPDLYTKGVNSAFVDNFLWTHNFTKNEICQFKSKYNTVIFLDGYDQIFKKFNPFKEEEIHKYNSKLIVNVRTEYFEPIVYGAYFNKGRDEAIYIYIKSLYNDQVRELSEKYIQRQIKHNKTKYNKYDDLGILLGDLDYTIKKMGIYDIEFIPSDLKIFLSLLPKTKFNLYLDTKFILDKWFVNEANKILKLNNTSYSQESIINSFIEYNKELAYNDFMNGEDGIYQYIGIIDEHPLFKKYFQKKYDLQRKGAPIKYIGNGLYTFKYSIFRDFFIADLFLDELYEFYNSDVYPTFFNNKLIDHKTHISNMFIEGMQHGNYSLDVIINSLLKLLSEKENNDDCNISYYNAATILNSYLDSYPEYLIEEIKNINKLKSSDKNSFFTNIIFSQNIVNQLLDKLDSDERDNFFDNFEYFNSLYVDKSKKKNININKYNILKQSYLDSDILISSINTLKSLDFDRILFDQDIIDSIIYKIINLADKDQTINKIIKIKYDNEVSSLIHENCNNILKKYNKNAFNIINELENIVGKVENLTVNKRKLTNDEIKLVRMHINNLKSDKILQFLKKYSKNKIHYFISYNSNLILRENVVELYGISIYNVCYIIFILMILPFPIGICLKTNYNNWIKGVLELKKSK